MGLSPLSSWLRGGRGIGEARNCRSRGMPSAAVDKEWADPLQDSVNCNIYIKLLRIMGLIAFMLALLCCLVRVQGLQSK